MGISVLLINSFGYTAWLVDHVLFFPIHRLQKQVIFFSEFQYWLRMHDGFIFFIVNDLIDSIKT